MIGDPTLVQHLDRACVQTARPRGLDLLSQAPLDDGHVNPCECQFGRQHHPCRTTSGDHHRMLGHTHTPVICRYQCTHFGPPIPLSRPDRSHVTT